ncbi:Poly(ADP-ribose) glycohydrolase 1 [Platanthera guangdongensis]|uniref:Poly(ADP-ribose) glycohydrolase 1 n=1 Tax=Platanthera guangdongensis TaxID=2320717 RepID=A0ABR2MUN8_9ASPA
MERREDLKSILPLLPFILRSSSLFWPSKALESLKALALGPDLSRVCSGEILFDAIVDIRDSLGLSHERLASHAGDGYSLFFDEVAPRPVALLIIRISSLKVFFLFIFCWKLMSRMDSRAWFGKVVPKLATLLLQLPSLLEAHYLDSDAKFGEGKAGLRLIDQQEAGIVILSQVHAPNSASNFYAYYLSSTAIFNFQSLNKRSKKVLTKLVSTKRRPPAPAVPSLRRPPDPTGITPPFLPGPARPVACGRLAVAAPGFYWHDP